LHAAQGGSADASRASPGCQAPSVVRR
jgi:hypothetical protein